MPSSFLDHWPTLYKLGIGKGKSFFSPLCPFIFRLIHLFFVVVALSELTTYISTFTFLNNTSSMFFILQFCYVSQVVIIHKYI
jgi:hypothetical protein